MESLGYSISAVERDTGLSKDVLRMWERRYGFPRPERDAHGERLYPAEQVARLRLIKRLMDQGHRPGRLIPASDEALAALAPRQGHDEIAQAPPDASDLSEFVAAIKRQDIAGFQQGLQQRLLRQGLQRFVTDTVAPLTRQVGLAWERGGLQVFEEHLYTELTKRVLRQAITPLSTPGNGPRVLLTTVPDEQHQLGLLMLEALLTLEGAECVPLGTETPLGEIAAAAEAHRADVVALSFSAAFPQRQIPALLTQLRALLTPRTALWCGGRGAARVGAAPGLQVISALDDAVLALARLRAGRRLDAGQAGMQDDSTNDD